jgi:hypothetical protein
MKLLYTLITFLILIVIAPSCQKTNRGIEIEYRTDTVLSGAVKDTTFVMDTANWSAYSNVAGGLVSSGSSTYINTSEGIKFFGQERYTGLRLQTKNEVNFKDRVIYYKWKVNGMGDYSAILPSIKYDPLTSDDYNPIQGVFFGFFTTERPHLTSVLVDDEVWYYTRVAPVVGTDNYQSITSKGNYSNAGGTVIFTSIVPVYTKAGYISLILLNSFSPSAYVILGECKILSQ